ncbi:MAG: hypothetical protein JSS20_05025 [Proteobacteria bacterium]|nr:hypothetical protein [Pseudomonadota bacterium]
MNEGNASAAPAISESSNSTIKDAAHPPRPARAGRYLAATLALTLCGVGAIAEANRRYAPELHDPAYMASIAETHAAGESYAVFDLNINIRKLREEQIKRLPAKPELVILGASQWQEAGADLEPGRKYFNAHVHRDYYEDILGVVDLLVRNDRLPRDLVITLRDKIFTPPNHRQDFLWLPTIPYYHAMADRLDLPHLSLTEQHLLQRPRELVSFATLFSNVTRWHNANDWPYPTTSSQLATLDILRPDGSIVWSKQHQAIFTQERSRKQALAMAEASRNKPVMIDPRGVEAVDRVLAYLAVRGVRVHLGQPPFNPIFFDAIKDSPYMEGLHQIEAITRELAEKHKLATFGSFDPAELGCTADMFIDAEHSNARCLSRLLADLDKTIDPSGIPVASAAAERAAIAAVSVAAATEKATSDVSESAAPPAPTATATSPQIEAARADNSPASATPDAQSIAARQAQFAASVVLARLSRPTSMTDADTHTPERVISADLSAPIASEVVSVLRKRAHARSVEIIPSKALATRSPRHAHNRTPEPKRTLVTAAPRMVWPGDAPVRSR